METLLMVLGFSKVQHEHCCLLNGNSSPTTTNMGAVTVLYSNCVCRYLNDKFYI